MENWFSKAFNEHSFLWLVISAIIGGLIGASIKLFFENILATNITNTRSARMAIKKYTYPLLRSSDSLNRYGQLLVENLEKKWFDDSDNDYFKMAILYQFSNFFGIVKLLENEAFIEFESTKKDVRKFNDHFYKVISSLNSFAYFKKSSWTSEELAKNTLNRMVITAIGEIMLVSCHIYYDA